MSVSLSGMKRSGGGGGREYHRTPRWKPYQTVKPGASAALPHNHFVWFKVSWTCFVDYVMAPKTMKQSWEREYLFTISCALISEPCSGRELWTTAQSWNNKLTNKELTHHVPTLGSSAPDPQRKRPVCGLSLSTSWWGTLRVAMFFGSSCGRSTARRTCCSGWPAKTSRRKSTRAPLRTKRTPSTRTTFPYCRQKRYEGYTPPCLTRRFAGPSCCFRRLPSEKSFLAWIWLVFMTELTDAVLSGTFGFDLARPFYLEWTQRKKGVLAQF